MGESAYILRDFDAEPYILARSIELAGVPGIFEIVPSIESIGLYVDPNVFKADEFADIKLVAPPKGISHVVPVMFDGSDVVELSKMISTEPDFLVKTFCDQEYTVTCLGFLPGFPYLKGLPDILSVIQRREEPRIHVPAGSVAIASGMAGIYPKQSPGGWNLLGTTPVAIVNVEDKYFPINPGDTVRFVEIEKAEFDKLKGKTLTDYAATD